MTSNKTKIKCVHHVHSVRSKSRTAAFSADAQGENKVKTVIINPKSAELFLYKTWETKGVFNLI